MHATNIIKIVHKKVFLIEVHHLVGNHQMEHAKTKCLYCNTIFDAKNWQSYHHGETHYKIMRCSCGKTLSVKVGFHGSGHDNWNKTNIIKEKNIEAKIIKAEQDDAEKKAEREITQAVQSNKEVPFNIMVGNLVHKFKNIESSKVMKMCNQARSKMQQFKQDLIDNQ